MDFFRKLFSKGELFIPTPTQEVSGIPPIVVQAIENLFPNIDHQTIAFMYVRELKESGRAFRDAKLFLALLAYSDGEIQKLRLAVSNMRCSAHFRWEEIDPIFPKMRNAEEWVKSITKTRT